MKKIKNVLSLTLLATTICYGSQAFAKTQGSYIGIDLLQTKSSHEYSRNGTTASNYREFDDSSIGYGLNYKYAFNFNDFFFAPSLFIEKLGTEAADQDRDTISINERYGAKIDFGYDFTDQFALYLTAGLANASYKVDWKSIEKKKSGNELGFLGGIGAAYYPHKNIAITLEYNMQGLEISTPNSDGINQADTRIRTIKIGAAYHF